MPRKKAIFAILVACAAIVALYAWIAAVAHDEAAQVRQQEKVDSVVRIMDDSLKADRELKQLLLDEQARTDSATEAERQIAIEAAADRKIDFLWSVYNEAARKGGTAATKAVFERHATPNFHRFLKQRHASLSELLFFPLDDLAATNIWHFQQDWFAVSTPTVGKSIVLRVTTTTEGNRFQIEEIRLASKPADKAYATDEEVDDIDAPN